jgi:hypothetical protein
MSHSYSSNRIHLIFSTKGRERSISAELQPKLWPYMAGEEAGRQAALRSSPAGTNQLSPARQRWGEGERRASPGGTTHVAFIF